MTKPSLEGVLAVATLISLVVSVIISIKVVHVLWVVCDWVLREMAR